MADNLEAYDTSDYPDVYPDVRLGSITLMMVFASQNVARFYIFSRLSGKQRQRENLPQQYKAIYLKKYIFTVIPL